ncbi:MAG: hypothetical protein IPQ07_09625 [Myxococcales bacterium]|nr:hypothetical protein [Myxococcales bacterium]
MSIDASRFSDAIRTIHTGTLSEADAETIVALAQLAVDADGREDPDEIATFFAIGKAVYAHAGINDAPTPTFAADEDDDERLQSLANQLTSPAAKELAYAVAFVMAVADIDLAPEEGAMVEALREALGIDEDRAGDLAATVSAAITPPA